MSLQLLQEKFNLLQLQNQEYRRALNQTRCIKPFLSSSFLTPLVGTAYSTEDKGAGSVLSHFLSLSSFLSTLGSESLRCCAACEVFTGLIVSRKRCMCPSSYLYNTGSELNTNNQIQT